jgi:hypothetical protein
MFLVDLRDVPLVAGEPHGHPVAETERGVVPAVERDRTNLEPGPLGELRGNQTRDHVHRDVCLAHGELS